MWLETAPKGKQKVRTDVLIGDRTQEAKSRVRAEAAYYATMGALATTNHGLAKPVEPKAAVTFDTFSAWYDTHHIAHHAGAEREREILKRLRSFFGPYPLDQITKKLVITWRTQRRTTAVTVDRFGAGAVVPKWRQIYDLLRLQGPLSLTAIRAHFGISTRNIARTFLTPQTSIYFRSVSRGVWDAFGTPKAAAHTYRPPAARTVNREVDLLQQILGAAVQAGEIAASPIYGLPNLEIVEPIRRTMSEEEERRVLTELAPADRAIMIAGTDTLARMINILDLQWADDHGSTLDIRDPKNGQSHTVPVSMRLRSALDALPRDGAYCFPGRREAKTAANRRRGFATALRKACERANVPYGRAVRGITFHWSTRRTGATRMIRRGGEKAIGVVQQIGGWKDPSVLIGIYQETITAEMHAAVELAAPRPRTTPPVLPRNAPHRRNTKKKR